MSMDTGVTEQRESKATVCHTAVARLRSVERRLEIFLESVGYEVPKSVPDPQPEAPNRSLINLLTIAPETIHSHVTRCEDLIDTLESQLI